MSNAPTTIVTLDGVDYSLCVDEITGRHELALWHETRMSVGDLLGAAEWPRFMVVTFVWLSRLVHGDPVSWDEVADLVAFDTPVSFVIEDPPKASAAA